MRKPRKLGRENQLWSKMLPSINQILQALQTHKSQLEEIIHAIGFLVTADFKS